MTKRLDRLLQDSRSFVLHSIIRYCLFPNRRVKSSSIEDAAFGPYPPNHESEAIGYTWLFFTAYIFVPHKKISRCHTKEHVRMTTAKPGSFPASHDFYWIPRCSRKVAPAYSLLNKPFSTSLGISCSKKMFIDFSDPPGRAMNPSIAAAS